MADRYIYVPLIAEFLQRSPGRLGRGSAVWLLSVHVDQRQLQPAAVDVALPAAGLPIALRDAHRQATGPRWRLGLATGVTVAAQLLLSEELLSTTFLIAALMAILLALVNRDRVIATLRYAGPPLVLGAGVALLIGGYP